MLMQTIAKRAARVGRSVALAIGVGVVLALVLGAATVALAAVPGDPFRLSRLNAVDAVSRLVGNVPGPMLVVDNDSEAANARALDLRVEPGRAPLVTSPDAGKATNLDADELDGQDSTAFFPARTYFDASDAVTGPGGGAPLVFIGVPCDPGDRILNAGGAANAEDDMIEERPVGSTGWLVRIRDNGARTDSTVVANCVDFPPLRP
jgi:hypothetical protein